MDSRLLAVSSENLARWSMRLGLLLLLGATVRAEGDDEEEESNIIELSADNFSDVTSDDDWKPWAVHFSSGAAESKGAHNYPRAALLPRSGAVL